MSWRSATRTVLDALLFSHLFMEFVGFGFFRFGHVLNKNFIASKGNTRNSQDHKEQQLSNPERNNRYYNSYKKPYDSMNLFRHKLFLTFRLLNVAILEKVIFSSEFFSIHSCKVQELQGW